MNHRLTAVDLYRDMQINFLLPKKQAFREEIFTHEEVFEHVHQVPFSAIESAEYLEISLATFSRYVQSGKIKPCQLVDNNKFFSAKNLQDFKKSLTQVHHITDVTEEYSAFYKGEEQDPPKPSNSDYQQEIVRNLGLAYQKIADQRCASVTNKLDHQYKRYTPKLEIQSSPIASETGQLKNPVRLVEAQSKNSTILTGSLCS